MAKKKTSSAKPKAKAVEQPAENKAVEAAPENKEPVIEGFEKMTFENVVTFSVVSKNGQVFVTYIDGVGITHNTFQPGAGQLNITVDLA